MLAALGLGKTRQWQPAKKLQKDGKVAKKQIIEYLETGERALSGAWSVEQLTRARIDGKQDNIKNLINEYQCWLIEHCGMEVMFGRQQLQHWIENCGTPDKPGEDPRMVKLVKMFENAINAAVMASENEAMMRKTLGLRRDGEDEQEEDDDQGDGTKALMPRRFAKSQDKMKTEGPVSRSTVLEWFKECKNMVLSKDTRDLLREKLKEYSTWKPDDRKRLCQACVLRWQSEKWEEMGVDRRLGLAEQFKPPDMVNEQELMVIQKQFFEACRGLTQWYSMPMQAGQKPKAEGRQIEPWCFREGHEKSEPLQEDGPVDPALMAECLTKTIEMMGSDEFGDQIENAAAEEDMMRAKNLMGRFTNEIYEGFGLEHEFGMIMSIALSSYPEVSELSSKMKDSVKKLSTRIVAGARKAQAKKDGGNDGGAIATVAAPAGTTSTTTGGYAAQQVEPAPAVEAAPMVETPSPATEPSK